MKYLYVFVVANFLLLTSCNNSSNNQNADHNQIAEQNELQIDNLTYEKVKEICKYIPDHKIINGSEAYITNEFYGLLEKSFEISDYVSRNFEENDDYALLDFWWVYYFVTGNDPGTPIYTVLNISYEDEKNAIAEINIDEVWDNGEYNKDIEGNIHKLYLTYENRNWKISNFDNYKQKCIVLINRYTDYQNTGEILIYEGEYTFNDYYELEDFPGRTFQEYVLYGPAHVKITNKQLDVEFEVGGGFNAYYKSTNYDNGTRIYNDYCNHTFYVSTSYNIYYRTFIDSPYCPGYSVHYSQKGQPYTSNNTTIQPINPELPTPNAEPNPTQKKHWITVTREVDCQHCWHSGKCSTCNGNGWYINHLTGKQIGCPNCTNGNCRFCGGRGTITKTEQVYE